MMPLLAAALLALALLGGPTAGIAASIPDRAEPWPLQPPVAVTRDFAPPDQPWLAGHRGVDLAGSPGAAVRAPIAGRITVARRIVDRGVVVISNGSRRVTLEPVRATVAPGEIVAVGDRIGVLQAGHRGCPQTACLHWGLLVGQQYRDPLLLVLDYRPVLLPAPAGREQR